jgi:aminoglycoside phosphotransferase (APT) family kinase protein
MTGGKLHDDELDIDAALVRDLVAAQFPQWRDLPLAAVPSAGTDNALYRLGADLVIRLPRAEWAQEGLQKERRWLGELAPHLPVAIPEPLALGEPGRGYPCSWSVYRWLDGRNPVPDELTDPRSLALNLAGFVEALHRFSAAGGPRGSRGGPLREREEMTRAGLAGVQELVDSGRFDVDTAAVARAWEAAVRAPAWREPPLWIHADLTPGNLLVADGRLTAVIDFGTLSVGDPACDLLVAWNLFSAETRPVFRAALGVDDATWERGRGWAVSVALVALPYYHTSNPALAANSMRVIDQVLSEEPVF